MKSKKVPLRRSGIRVTTYDLGCKHRTFSVRILSFCQVEKKKSNPRKALFIFRRKIGIEDIANKYFADRLEVKAEVVL